MAEVTIKDQLWQGIKTVARRKRRKPERLAETVLQEFLLRQADEQLLSRSEHAARRSPFRIEDTEEMIRQYRRRKRKA